jgi:hypothetical protein
MGKILPFVVPPNNVKLAAIKFAEELLAIEKASFNHNGGTFEFGIFLACGLIIGAGLSRNTEGTIVDGYVRQFREADGLKWFQDLQQRIL